MESSILPLEEAVVKGYLTPEKRKQIEALILGVFGTLDATGANRMRWQQRFNAMTDTQLERWLRDLGSSDERQFYLEVVPYKNEPGLAQIEKAAKLVGAKLHERVFFRHDGAASAPVGTRAPVPVGWLHVRRLQQILAKKTSYSTEIRSRSQVTGQLTGSSAVGRLADEEAYSLRTIGATSVLKELLGPRADNRDKRLGMYAAIERDGFVRQSDLHGDTAHQPALNYMDVLLLAAGLSSDLVNEGNLLRHSVDRPSLPRA
jgi:hypothetical protein